MQLKIIMICSSVTLAVLGMEKESARSVESSFSSISILTGPAAKLASQRQQISASFRASQKAISSEESKSSSQPKKVLELPSFEGKDDVQHMKGLSEIYFEFLPTILSQEEQNRLRKLVSEASSLNELVLLHPTIKNEIGDTALHEAVKRNQLIKVEWLCRLNVNVRVVNMFGESPLHHVEDTAIAQYLCDGNADINLKDFDSECTPLYSAVHRSRRDIVMFLLRRGADPKIKNSDGWTPLYCAAVSGPLEIVEDLCAFPEVVNEPNKEGRTPIFAAVSGGDKDKVECLIRSRAQVKIRSKDKSTLLSICYNVEISRLLRQAGAEVTREIIKEVTNDEAKKYLKRELKHQEKDKD